MITKKDQAKILREKIDGFVYESDFHTATFMEYIDLLESIIEKDNADQEVSLYETVKYWLNLWTIRRSKNKT
jgi:hypothetical protein